MKGYMLILAFVMWVVAAHNAHADMQTVCDDEKCQEVTKWPTSTNTQTVCDDEGCQAVTTWLSTNEDD